MRKGRAKPRREGFVDFWIGRTDLAPLGLFRIVFGLLVFNWFWQLYPDLTAFFTDEGFMPRRSLFVYFPDRFSLLHLFGDWWQVAIFWAVALVAAACLTVGYRTRLAAVLCFLAVISFEQRNPLILDGSDLVFRVIPFWLAFTAAGSRFSVDAALRRARGEQADTSGWALPIRILQLQVGWIYLATGVEKLGGKRWVDGSAAYYALQLKHTFGRWWADPLVRFDPLVKAVSWGTLAVEIGFLPLTFFPILQPFLRLAVVAAAGMMHFGILTMMNVGNFPVIMLATLILFLPAGWIVGFLERLRPLFASSRVRVLYDGGCHFCRRTIAFLHAVDFYRTIESVDFRSSSEAIPGVDTAALEKRMHLIDDSGRVYSGFAAFARAARSIPLLLPLAIVGAVPPLARLAERAYDWVAEQRLLLLACPGERCELHPEERASAPVARRVIRETAWAPALATMALVVVATTAFATAMPKPVGWSGLAQPVASTMRLMSLEQRWDMFSPDPAHSDGWMRAPGRLKDGTTVDLIGDGGRPLPRDPKLVVDPEPRYSDVFYTRWVKVHERMASAALSEYRLEYGRMFCRMRNFYLAPGESALDTFEVFYTERIIQEPGQPDVLREHRLWTHQC